MPFWKEGKLSNEFRQFFNFIAETNLEYKQKMAVSREKNGHHQFGSPWCTNFELSS